MVDWLTLVRSTCVAECQIRVSVLGMRGRCQCHTGISVQLPQREIYRSVESIAHRLVGDIPHRARTLSLSQLR